MQSAPWKRRRPSRRGRVSSSWAGMWLCSTNSLAVRSETLARLTYCLHLLTHSCTAFFFLVACMCWFLSLLLGLCPRRCIISVFAFGSHGSGRYLHLDSNVNIIHPQVNNSNKIRRPESLYVGRRAVKQSSWDRAIPSITAPDFAPPAAIGPTASLGAASQRWFDW